MSTLCGLGYWVQGFRCFPWLALNFHMAHNLNFDPSTLQLVQSSASLPMAAKPLYGILSDALCMAGLHRIPYICIGVLVQILSWGQLALIPVAGQAVPALMACVVLGNLGASIEEVSKDALVTEYGQKHRIKGLQSYSFMALAVGGILGNFLGGYLLLKLQPRTMFLVFSALLSLQLAISSSECIGLLQPEGRNQIRSSQSITDNIRKQLSGLMIAIGEDTIFRPLTWIATSIAAVPVLSGPIFCYQTQYLNLDLWVIGMSKVVGQLMLLSLTLIYDHCWKQIPMRKLVGGIQFVYGTSLLLDLILVTQINVDVFQIPNEVFALCFCGLAETIAQFKILPFTVLLATLCPRGLLIQFVAALLPLGWIHQLPIAHPVDKEIKNCIEEIEGFEELLHLEPRDFTSCRRRAVNPLSSTSSDPLPMGKKKDKTLNESESTIDMKSMIHENALFFDKLVELIPARFYLPDEKDKPWFQGLSKAEKASAKKQSRENIKKARRDRLDPEKSMKTTLDLLKENLEKEKLNMDSDGEEEEIEVRPIMSDLDGGEEQSVTYEELRERLRRKIEELRGGRNTAGSDKGKKRKNERNDKNGNLQKKQKRDGDASNDENNVKKEIEEAAKELTFSHVKLGDNDDRRGKKRKLSKFKELESAMKLEEAKKDPAKGNVFAKKHSWKAAMDRAAGIKVHDNPKLLKQSIHKEKKRHQKNAEKWNERVETTEKMKAEKQQKRSENIADKIHQKKMRRIAKREKKLLRPGFEGRKEGFINEGST
ncbi:hypothetical protein V6N11_074074 [Hibiscus sabdariffa]|uniref:Surfeit locus protein 6 n=1 Tax=Hibiscus sabdariffa TaxID=183260 RepID=A0ABR1ZII5_9ROSI